MIKPTITLQELRTRIAQRAKSAPEHRFWGLYVHIAKLETLETAYAEARRNGGAAGVDGVTFEQIESAGRDAFLTELAEALRAHTYRPAPLRRREIPKEGGKVRVISIPTIRDRVTQGAVRLVLEPIFEADFSDSSYGARPRRSAHQALEVVSQGLLRRRLRVVDVDLSRFFDTIRHDRMMAKLARRIRDDAVLGLLKQFLVRTGERGIPQGSPLSPLLANLALNDLDHALDRGKALLTYVRYLDDMVVLAPDSHRGRAWSDRALQRIREEAELIGVSLNMDKTRTVTMTDHEAMFAFLGFEFRWSKSRKTSAMYPCKSPRPKKVTHVLRAVRDVLRIGRHLHVRDAVQRINEIVRGWVNYFRIGNASRAFAKVRYGVELKVRRFAMRQRKRSGFGWKRWNREVVYGTWGLFSDYRLAYGNAAARTISNGRITPHG
jgi:RNA-directed DNA polymerase